MSDALDSSRQQRLLEVGRSLLSELDLEAVLDQVLETARELTGARYAALGVLNEQQSELERFITRGIGEEARRHIGELPRGRGILGVLIDDPRPLRLDDVNAHPQSYGFPAAHPPMHSFLGVPILIRGRAWGNLYLTEKATGPFDEADEEAIVMLADWAAIAIANARLYREVERRRAELERAAHGLEASQAIAVAVGAETRLERVLELIAKRGRALVNARSLVILLHEGDELVLAASAGHGDHRVGQRIPVAGSSSGEVLRDGQPKRISDVSRLRIAPDTFGVSDTHSALLVPLVYHRQALGVLLAFDPGADASFSMQDEQSLKAFAASAATAVATAQTVAEHRLRDTLASADAERRRWARELHDETLQALGGLRVTLSAARRRESFEVLKDTTDQVIEQLDHEIASLRAIITELRPAVLDELGLSAAVEALIERHRTISGLEIGGELSLNDADGADTQFDPELATAIYRLVQESLANVVKHAAADHVHVVLAAREGTARVEISDDGGGFDTAQRTAGFGLTGMRERVGLAGGELIVDSGPNGTTITATLPIRMAEPTPPLRSAG